MSNEVEDNANVQSATETEGEGEEVEVASLASSSSSSSSGEAVEAEVDDDDDGDDKEGKVDEASGGEKSQRSPSKVADNLKTPSPKKKASTPKKTPGSSSKKSYIDMAQEAIIALKDRTGSSQIAIQKYILSQNPNVDLKKLKQHLNRSLKTGVANKRFIKIKASYKLHPNAKKKPKAKPKSKAKAAIKKKVKKEKKLTPAQIAAKKEKERREKKERERLEKIRKRKFPMEDIALIAEDKELGVSHPLPSRPALGLAYPKLPAACKSDTMGTGILDDLFHIYHFFRGDVGWGRYPKQKEVVAPFTLSQWMECVKLVIDGTAKKSRMVPPLMSHLFVVSLQHLVPNKLQVGLTPASWSEILLLYMDAAERYYTTEATEGKNVLPGLPIDTEYLLAVTDETKDESLLESPGSTNQDYFYLKGSLHKAHSKLLTNDPWTLTAEELLSLLRALVDDMLATLPECSDEIDNRLLEVNELQKTKRSADAHLRKLITIKNKELAEAKESADKTKETGEKPTRSNTKLPKVSEAQLESARRAQQRATDAFEKASRSKRARTTPIGEDRNFNQYYHFGNDPERVFVSQKGKAMPASVTYKVPTPENCRTSWHSIEKRSVLEKVMASLDVRGTRESVLHEGLGPARRAVYDDIKVINDQKRLLNEMREKQRRLENAKMKCEVGRKSGRLAAQSEQEFSVLQAEIDHLEAAIKSGAQEPKIDLDFETGLTMLGEFDRQDAPENRRRTTRRDAKKKQEKEDETEKSLPRLLCSRLWPTRNVDGTGLVGSIIFDLLTVEERVQKLSAWENGDRKSWISTLESAAYTWDSFTLTADSDAIDTKEGKSNISPPQTTSQLLNTLKQPLLQLEKRVFEMTGLAMATKDADEADDNMSTSPEEDEQEKLELAWKRIVNRLKYYPAKAHSKIRQAVVEGIAAARKAHLPIVVGQLREALLQFHPEAAGACKSSALEVLIEHGDYDDTDDLDDEELEGEEEEELNVQIDVVEGETGISSALCAEAIVMLGSLDGQEDASRVDWIAAVKKARTVSKMASLVAAFSAKVSERLEKMELELQHLNDAIEAWDRAARRKTPSNDPHPEPTEVWADVTFTDDFCLAKSEAFVWWPARICVAKNKDLAESLSTLGRTLVSLVGEAGDLRVVKTDDTVPFSETPPENEALTHLTKDGRAQLDDCMTMAKRIIRGQEKKASRGRKKPKVAPPAENGEFKEEKKLAS